MKQCWPRSAWWLRSRTFMSASLYFVTEQVSSDSHNFHVLVSTSNVWSCLLVFYSQFSFWPCLWHTWWVRYQEEVCIYCSIPWCRLVISRQAFTIKTNLEQIQSRIANRRRLSQHGKDHRPPSTDSRQDPNILCGRHLYHRRGTRSIQPFESLTILSRYVCQSLLWSCLGYVSTHILSWEYQCGKSTHSYLRNWR